MKEDLIKPDWFDDWFSRNFPESVLEYSPKQVASGFRVSLSSVYRRIRSGEIGSIQFGQGSSVIIVPRFAVYDFALSCYTLNK